MSYEIARAVWNYTGDELNGVQTAILVRMAWYASDAGRDIFPSKETLAQQTKFSLTAVKSAIKYLVDKNFLRVAKGSKGRHRINYEINLDKLKVVQQFDESSSQIDDDKPVARRPVKSKPVARRPVEPVVSQPVNQSPDDHIKTSKDNLKNNSSSNADAESLKNFAEVHDVTFETLQELVISHGKDEVERQLMNLGRRRGIMNPDGWLRMAVANRYAMPDPKPSSFSMPSSHEPWSEETQHQRNQQVEAQSDPNDWREQEIQKRMAQLSR